MINSTKLKKTQRVRRHNRVRAKVYGTKERPRLAFFRSNKQVYAQIIDDTKGSTLASASSLKSKLSGLRSRAEELGKTIADEATKKGISKICFDRGGFLYTGSVKAFADSARKNGLNF